MKSKGGHRQTIRKPFGNQREIIGQPEGNHKETIILSLAGVVTPAMFERALGHSERHHDTVAVVIRFAPKCNFSNANFRTFRKILRAGPIIHNGRRDTNVCMPQQARQPDQSRSESKFALKNILANDKSAHQSAQS